MKSVFYLGLGAFVAVVGMFLYHVLSVFSTVVRDRTDPVMFGLGALLIVLPFVSRRSAQASDETYDPAM